jgi:hypothetical protein
MTINYDSTKYLFLGTKELKKNFKRTNSVVSTTGKWKDFNAFACASSNTIILHTEAYFWHFLIGLGNEDSLVNELSKSLIHENCHMVIADLGFGGHKYDMEEKVVRLLAGQD